MSEFETTVNELAQEYKHIQALKDLNDWINKGLTTKDLVITDLVHESISHQIGKLHKTFTDREKELREQITR